MLLYEPAVFDFVTYLDYFIGSELWVELSRLADLVGLMLLVSCCMLGRKLLHSLIDLTLENCGGDCFTDTPGIETLIHSTRVDDMFLMHVVMGLWLVIELAALFDLVDFGFVCCLGISILLDLMLLSLDLFFMLLQRELSFVYLVCVRLGFVLGFMVLQIDSF
eukprot:gene2709-1694_t